MRYGSFEWSDEVVGTLFPSESENGSARPADASYSPRDPYISQPAP
jgi:hypothetical protein